MAEIEKQKSEIDERKELIDDLTHKLYGYLNNYYLIGIRSDREKFYSFTQEELEQNGLLRCGVYMNLIMDGKLDDAEKLLQIEDSDTIRWLGMLLVHPRISIQDFIRTVETLKKRNTPIRSVLLTAGRPYILNGLYDFTKIGPLLERNRELIIEDMKYIYEPNICPAIYSLCLAEYYYQQNRILDAEILVNRTIKEFDRASENRLLFSALHLQTKILLAQGKVFNIGSYIKDCRKFIDENGEMEFSYNIDTAEVMAAFYEGNHELITQWIKTKAPDEFSNFNMLDLYRYMVKIRCYIITKKYTAVVALAEKLRPLLEEGHRQMDLCEIDILLTICFYHANEKKLAFESLERALKIAKRRKFYRLIADEGEAILQPMIEYIKTKGETPFLMKLVDIARDVTIHHPLYLKPLYKNKETFTHTELDILRLLEQGMTKESIAEYFFVSVNTIKYHLKNIYSKLDAKSASQAVWEARVIGLI